MEGQKIVFIGNLSWVTNNESLFEFLLQAENIVHAQVQRHEDTNRSKGWGLAEFTTHEAAVQAINLLDRKEFNGRQVHMRLDRSNSPVNESSYSVYIGNLAWAVTDKELLELFQAFHPLACNVLTNMYGRSRGFAIMKFRSDVDAENAIRAMNHVEIAGRKLECRVDRGPVKPEESDGKNSIFVSKLGSSIVDNAELAGLFSHIAPVVSATIQKSLQGRPKGWGIVKFQTFADAKQAVETMNGMKLPGSDAHIEVRFDRK